MLPAASIRTVFRFLLVGSVLINSAMEGNGKGEFRAVPGQESGIELYGQQRGAALCDFDHDGRVDLAVSQNAGPIRLYHNEGARPGIRVRLRGPPSNRAAIGAILRAKQGETWGPAREIRCGSGYWSQDGLTQIFGGNPPNAIQVLWPGGAKRVFDIPSQSREVLLDSRGEIEPRP